MSILFGIRKAAGETVREEQLLDLAKATARYAPDGTFIHSSGRVGMVLQPYHTHQRSNLGHRPVHDDADNLLSFDGRLDNYAELCHLLEIEDEDRSDPLIVLAAFRRWGEACFSKFIGDWALALWSAAEQMVYLARDHAGTRSLYFRNTGSVLQWSTYLETFFAAGETYPLDEQYAYRYLGSLPTFDLTPYKGLQSVPPAHYLVFSNDRLKKASHWEWIAKEKIRYRLDADYEEHFFSLLTQSVSRRDGPGAPGLAQLSGGMDSSSIVCTSDHVRRLYDPHAILIDTMSFYDESETTWNERPYFSVVEAKRGKAGIHLETSFMDRTFDPAQGVYLLPGADSSAIEWERKLQYHFEEHGYRSVLSGVGGDEVLGGVPTSLPELTDCAMSGNLNLLLRRTIAWCLVDRRPLIHMLFDTVRFTAHLYRRPQIAKANIPRWITPRLRRRCVEFVDPPETRNIRGWGRSPSAVNNGLTWWSIMETLPHLRPAFVGKV